MPPTQLSPNSTFHNAQASSLYGLLDMPKSPTSMTLAEYNAQSYTSAFPYFYSIPETGSVNAVSKNLVDSIFFFIFFYDKQHNK